MADPVFPITLDDTSPTIVYAPFGDSFGVPDLSSGWNPYYTDSGFATDPGPLSSGPGVSDIGNGTSLHLTASDGAQLAIKWNGTAIDIHGTVTGLPSASMSYSISLDGTATTNYFSSQSPSASVGNATTDVLAGFSNLTYGEHEVVLTVHNLGVSGSSSAANLDAVVAFDRAILYMETSGSYHNYTKPLAQHEHSFSLSHLVPKTLSTMYPFLVFMTACAHYSTWHFASLSCNLLLIHPQPHGVSS